MPPVALALPAAVIIFILLCIVAMYNGLVRSATCDEAWGCGNRVETRYEPHPNVGTP